MANPKIEQNDITLLEFMIEHCKNNSVNIVSSGNNIDDADIVITVSISDTNDTDAYSFVQPKSRETSILTFPVLFEYDKFV